MKPTKIESIQALARIEKKLEKMDGLFKHSKERDDIKIVLDYLLKDNIRYNCITNGCTAECRKCIRSIDSQNENKD